MHIFVLYFCFRYFFTENNAACMVSTKLIAAIKEKRNQEEIMSVLNEIPDDDSDQMNSLKVSIDILFSSNRNIHKSSCGLCFWASYPLIERF